MKRFISLLFTIACLCIVTVACAADPAAVVPLDAGNIAAAKPSFMAWVTANLPIILGVALALSEALAVIPQFQGNGLLDTVIRSLRALSGRPATPPDGGA